MNAEPPDVPRRSIARELLPVIAAAVPFVFISVCGFPAGDDWQLELARVAAYSHALLDGQLPPFWAPTLYAGYGSPIFLFYGQGFLAFASALSLLVRSTSAGFLLALALAASLGSFTMRLCASAAIADTDSPESSAAARVGAVLYLTNPYLLCDLLLRNAASELTALMWMPLALYGLWRSGASFWLALGFAFTLITHLLSTLSLFGLIVCLVIAEGMTLRRTRSLCAAGVVSCALTAFAWFPVVAYRSQLRAADLLEGKLSFRANFQPALSLFTGTTAYSAGPIALIAAVAALIALRRAELARPLVRRVRALLVLFALLVLLQLPLTTLAWEHLPGLAYLQFPWRLMGPLALMSAVLGSFAFHVLTRELPGAKRATAELAIFAVCVAATGAQLFRTQTITRDARTQFEAMLTASNMSTLRFTTTVGDEYLPPGADWTRVRAPAQAKPIVGGPAGARGQVTSDRPRDLTLEVETADAAKLCLARWAYPGWRVEVDDRVCDEPSCSPCAAGQLGVQVPAGHHHVRARLEAPPARRWGLVISASAAVAALAWALRRHRSRST